MNEYRDTSNRLNFDFSKVELKDYSKLTKSVVKEFSLNAVNVLIHDLDVAFQDYGLDNFLIGLEWDIWSGYTVVAQNSDSESIAREVAEFIKKKHNKLL